MVTLSPKVGSSRHHCYETTSWTFFHPKCFCLLLLIPLLVGWATTLCSLQSSLFPWDDTNPTNDNKNHDAATTTGSTTSSSASHWSSSQPTRIATNYPNETAALCLIVKDAEAYLDEWIDYHYYVNGFGAFYIYDNSDQHFLQSWSQQAKQQRHNVTVLHWPGDKQQRPAYYHCAMTYGPHHTWLAFWDDDEFLVFVQREQHIVDFLHDNFVTQNIGAVSFNWLIMGWANQTIYQPKPVLQRFPYSDPTNYRNKHVKTIMLSQAYQPVELQMHHNPHAHFLRPGYRQVSAASGRLLYQEPLNRTNHNHDHTYSMPSFYNQPFELDHVVLHHYRTKSVKEWIHRGMRGRASSPQGPLTFHESLQRPMDHPGTAFHPRAWQLLQQYVPKYRWYQEELPLEE